LAHDWTRPALLGSSSLALCHVRQHDRRFPAKNNCAVTDVVTRIAACFFWSCWGHRQRQRGSGIAGDRVRARRDDSREASSGADQRRPQVGGQGPGDGHGDH
ncbi:hypothetical protein PBRA_000964, partial [Plasmodiophora brassicae]